MKSRNAYFYFFGIFCYVGVEQGINNWSSEFLYQYHSLDPEVIGIEVISSFWGNLTIGTVVSLLLIKIIDEIPYIKEINFNLGCPSSRVQENNLGLSLTQYPEIVENCLEQLIKSKKNYKTQSL